MLALAAVLRLRNRRPVRRAHRRRDLPRRQRYHTKEKSRGRREERYYYSTPVPDELRNQEAWTDLRSVGWVISITTRDGKESSEVRGYISSLRADAAVSV